MRTAGMLGVLLLATVAAASPPHAKVPALTRFIGEREGSVLIYAESEPAEPQPGPINWEPSYLVVDAQRCVVETLLFPRLYAWSRTLNGARESLQAPSEDVRTELRGLSELLLRFGVRSASMSGVEVLFGKDGRVAFESFRTSGWLDETAVHWFDDKSMHNLEISPSGARIVGTSCAQACETSWLEVLEAGSATPTKLVDGIVGEMTFLDDDTLVFLADNHVGAKDATRSCIRQHAFATRRTRDLRCFTGPQRTWTYLKLSPGHRFASYSGSFGDGPVMTRVLKLPSMRDTWSTSDVVGAHSVDDQGRILDETSSLGTRLRFARHVETWPDTAPVGVLANGNVLLKNVVRGKNLDDVRCELFREVSPKK